jgi:hypothetical protein
MEHNKAHGPDGFSAEFYQYFWNVVKGQRFDGYVLSFSKWWLSII